MLLTVITLVQCVSYSVFLGFFFWTSAISMRQLSYEIVLCILYDQYKRTGLTYLQLIGCKGSLCGGTSVSQEATKDLIVKVMPERSFISTAAGYCSVEGVSCVPGGCSYSSYTLNRTLNHGMIWIGKDFKNYLIPAPLPQEGTPYTRPGCSEPCPT